SGYRHGRSCSARRTRRARGSAGSCRALLEDRGARGWGEETWGVGRGERGRTPGGGQSVGGGAGAGRDGRDHWPHVFTTVLAGGPIKAGVVHGSSDRYAAFPASNPTSPPHLGATIYRCLGVDPRLELPDKLRRPVTLCNGAPIRSILC